MTDVKDQEMKDFLSKCTPWREPETYFFTDNDGVKGTYRHECQYYKRDYAIGLLREPQDFTTTVLPKSLPAMCEGTYCFLIDLSAFDFQKYRSPLIHDFLHPWDASAKQQIQWIKRENGTVKVGYSRHATYRHIRRNITFFINENGKPASNVLYQYIVAPEEPEASDAKPLNVSKSSEHRIKNVEMLEKVSESEGVQRKVAEQRNSDHGQGPSTVMTSANSEEDAFLSKCTMWGEDGCYKFELNSVTGLYHKEPVYAGKAWSVQMISDWQDWVTSKRPESFPLNTTGSFRYLVDPSAFARETNSVVADCFDQDWVEPGKTLRWNNIAYEKGNVRHTHSNHPRAKNIRRYITFYSDEDNLPISPVLYQYVVYPPAAWGAAQQPTSSKPKSKPQKRQSEVMDPAETYHQDRLESPKQIAKKRKMEFHDEPGCSKASPVQRKITPRRAEKKPVTMVRPTVPPTPPVSEPCGTPQPAKQEEKEIDPVFTEMEKAYSDLQNTIAETKKRYCALTNPREMTAMNQKLIRLYNLESEIKERIGRLAEHTVTMTRDIDMEMEEPLPTYQPLQAVANDSDMDTPQRRHVEVKIE